MQKDQRNWEKKTYTFHNIQVRVVIKDRYGGKDVLYKREGWMDVGGHVL